jgi:hypothetical protein
LTWIIITFVTAAAIFGDRPHPFSSNMHFATEEKCKAYRQMDAEELLDELESMYGPIGEFHLESHCEQDTDGEPV